MNSAHSNYSTLTSFEFWDHIFPKRVFLVQNRQSSYHNWILHIRLRLGSKFQLKMTILIFWQVCPKLVFQKIALLFVSMVITYFINLIRKVANRHNNTSVSILLLVAETIRNAENIYFAKRITFEINLSNYHFIWTVEHRSVPSIFNT